MKFNNKLFFQIWKTLKTCSVGLILTATVIIMTQLIYFFSSSPAIFYFQVYSGLIYSLILIIPIVSIHFVFIILLGITDIDSPKSVIFHSFFSILTVFLTLGFFKWEFSDLNSKYCLGKINKFILPSDVFPLRLNRIGYIYFEITTECEQIPITTLPLPLENGRLLEVGDEIKILKYETQTGIIIFSYLGH